jgi:type IV pilus assembly protein PilW
MFSVQPAAIRPYRQQGFSLIELMVGITLGLVVITAISLLFVNSSRTRTETEKTGQQIENGRYTAQLLMDEFQLAGYYGELNPANVATPTTKPDPCVFDAASLKAALAMPLQGYDNPTSFPTCLSDVRTGSGTTPSPDIVVIRRASTCIAGSTGCDPVDTTKSTYFQTTLCPTSSGQYVIDTNSSSFTLTKKDCTSISGQRAYYTRIYFVANNNNPGDGIPTLKVAELGSGGFTTSSLVAGIEQFQVEYGIDTNADGAPDVYTANPDAYNACTGVACQNNWRAVTTVKLHLLVRNTQSTTGFPENRTYVLGRLANGSDNTFGPYNDSIKRHVYTTVVRLNNVAGRLE